MVLILFERLEFAFQCFESLSNGSNLLSNASNLFRMVRIGFEYIESLSNASNPFRIVRIPFEWFEFAFECFESRVVRIWMQMLQITFELLEYAFECIESLSSG